MASSYPTSLDAFTNPTSGDNLDSPDHATQHADVNDATEALQAKVGTGSGTPTSGRVLKGGSTAGSSEWADDVPVSDGTLSVGDLVTVKSLSPLVVEGTPSGTYSLYPWHVYVPATMAPYAQTNWTGYQQVSGDYLGARLSSSAAQNDSITYRVPLGAGTWRLDLTHSAGSNRGIYTVKFDGATEGTIDGYNSTVAATRSSITGIAVAASALVDVQLVMATKNASSSGYLGAINGLTFTRTA